MKWIIRLFLIVISVGWIAPAWFGITCLLQWCNDEMHGTHSMHTIDHLGFFRFAILLTLIWIVVVTCCWLIAFFWVKDKNAQ